jgi:hypothetical protein
MEPRQLGTTDMQITPLGFGTWAIAGGNWEYAWGPQDDRTAIEVMSCETERWSADGAVLEHDPVSTDIWLRRW